MSSKGFVPYEWAKERLELSIPQRFDDAEKMVIELNESTWIDYLTGLTVSLSSNKNRLGIRTAPDVIKIPKNTESKQSSN